MLWSTGVDSDLDLGAGAGAGADADAIAGLGNFLKSGVRVRVRVW